MDIRSLQLLQQIFQSPATEATRTRDHQVSEGAASAAVPTDEASLSQAGSLITRAASASDIRPEKIAAIQKALAQGTYQVSAEKVADSVLRHMLND